MGGWFKGMKLGGIIISKDALSKEEIQGCPVELSMRWSQLRSQSSPESAVSCRPSGEEH